MEKYVLLFCLSLFAIGANAQEENSVDSKTSRKLTRQQKIEKRKSEDEATAKMVDMMVKTRQFVLEANYLSNQYGERAIVESRLNFIAIDSNKITIQLASTTGIGGSNGMGGVTADGTITKFELKKTGRSGNMYSIQVFALTHFGSFDIFFTVSPDTNTDASIGGNWSGKLNYHGSIVPLKKSRVFKGMSI
jgi:hypothetical protein